MLKQRKKYTSLWSAKLCTFLYLMVTELTEKCDGTCKGLEAAGLVSRTIAEEPYISSLWTVGAIECSAIPYRFGALKTAHEETLTVIDEEFIGDNIVEEDSKTVVAVGTRSKDTGRPYNRVDEGE